MIEVVTADYVNPYAVCAPTVAKFRSKIIIIIIIIHIYILVVNIEAVGRLRVSTQR